MNKNILTSIGIGIFFGVLMALLTLYMMISSSFTLFTPAFWISIVVSCALPHCLSIVKVEGFRALIAQLTMIILSFLITLIYACFITNASELSRFTDVYSQVLVFSALLHICACVSVFVRALIFKMLKKKQ